MPLPAPLRSAESREDALRYFQQATSDLSVLARQNNFAHLVYLLEMASLEVQSLSAAEGLKRLRQ